GHISLLCLPKFPKRRFLTTYSSPSIISPNPPGLDGSVLGAAMRTLPDVLQLLSATYTQRAWQRSGSRRSYYRAGPLLPAQGRHALGGSLGLPPRHAPCGSLAHRGRRVLERNCIHRPRAPELPKLWSNLCRAALLDIGRRGLRPDVAQ